MTIIPAVTRSISAAVAVALLVAACATASPTASPSISASGTAASRTAGPTRAVTGPPASGPTPAETPGDTPGIVTPQPATPSPRPSRTPASTAHPSVVPSPSAAVTPAPTVAPTSYPPIAGLDEVLGSDGRFTVLVLGSDARPGLIGRRTDTIMVLTISPVDGVVAAVSLPRDMEGVPTGPGRIYGAKVTGLYQSFTSRGSTNAEAAEQTREALAYAFGTEIDRYVFIGFEGLTRLVDAVGGVDVTLARPLDDTFILVDGKRGFHLKKGVNHLTGKTALLFARTRHADNDYERTRRQQQLIVAAAKALRDRGAADLPALLSLAMDQVETDIPFTSMPALFELLGRADLAAPRGAVLGPNQYAGAGRARYSIVMRVAAVRTLFDRWFGPVTQP